MLDMLNIEPRCWNMPVWSAGQNFTWHISLSEPPDKCFARTPQPSTHYIIHVQFWLTYQTYVVKHRASMLDLVSSVNWPKLHGSQTRVRRRQLARLIVTRVNVGQLTKPVRQTSTLKWNTLQHRSVVFTRRGMFSREDDMFCRNGMLCKFYIFIEIVCFTCIL